MFWGSGLEMFWETGREVFWGLGMSKEKMFWGLGVGMFWGLGMFIVVPFESSDALIFASSAV
jgi:hypothetical protein